MINTMHSLLNEHRVALEQLRETDSLDEARKLNTRIRTLSALICEMVDQERMAQYVLDL